MPANGDIKVTFASTDWDISSVSGGDLSTDFCETGCALGSVSITPSSPDVTISGLIPNELDGTTSETIKYTLKSIKNP